MKFKFFNLFSIACVLCMAISCKKEENKVYMESATPIVLASSASAINLTFANAQKEVIKFSWNNPEYQFTTGVSSQDVTYKIEIDTAGANFTNPNKKVFSFGKDLSYSITDSALNDALLNQLSLKDSIPHNIEVRVIASLINNAVPQVSNVIKFTNVVPYAIPPKVAVPSTGELYLVGNATPGGDATGWNNPVPDPAQKFTQVSPTLYELTIQLNGGKEFLLLPVNGSWDNKYAVPDKTAANLSEGGDFGFNQKDNFPGPANSGTYKITVDFQKGKFTVTKL